jgi:hypothetical protein
MINIDFSKIRSDEGSQQKEFEELVCQLANMEKPDNAYYFVRKRGDGGDAGIECFWKIKNGSEHGWQAKYFINEMNSNRWYQITASIKIALEKHPNLTKYYVCRPLDRTDCRKSGRGSKKVISLLDKWNEYSKKWSLLAKEKNMNIEFIYWGKSEFQHISIIFSCRSTFLDNIVPKNILNGIQQFMHPGFHGNQHKAATKFLKKFDFTLPSISILLPELVNPLLLKTFCRSIKEKGLSQFPKGINKMHKLFEFYLDYVKDNIERRKGYRKGDLNIHDVLKSFAQRLYPDNLFGIPTKTAHKIIESEDPKPNTGISLFDEFINEGILSEDIDY